MNMNNPSNKSSWELVDEPDYYRDVLGSMRSLGCDRTGVGSVQFGILGTGYAPNYQVHSPDGSRTPFRGIGHSIFAESETFEEDHLSSSYSFTDIQSLLEKALHRRKSV
jgi:hypothetical protein